MTSCQLPKMALSAVLFLGLGCMVGTIEGAGSGYEDDEYTFIEDDLTFTGGHSGEVGSESTAGDSGNVDTDGAPTGGTGSTVPEEEYDDGTHDDVFVDDAPAAVDPCVNAIFCETFDDKPAGKINNSLGALKVKSLPGATLNVDSTRVFSGARSFHATIDRSTSTWGQAQLSLPLQGLVPSPRKTVYARMMLWLDDMIQTKGHWDVIGVTDKITWNGQTTEGNVAYGGYANGDSRMLYFQDFKPRWTDCSVYAPARIPVKRWTCIEFKIDTGAAVQYGVKIDGKSIPEYEIKDGEPRRGYCGTVSNGFWPVPEVIDVDFGWRHIHAQPTKVELWMDDLIVDTKPIGCPNM